ncbi:integral membrane [Trichoderma arundinaceum]|uniref:Integral membrane n=1 Tax=Trichoderma arundinaceum TaxID=490622 RepID=A0A395NQ09_TRIAR|nr:integral membrane [Trichoderma arundinaceum]
MQGVFVIFCAFEFRALSYGYGAADVQPGYNPMLAAEFFVIAQLLYLIAQLAAKISVALVLYRIASMAPLVRRILAGSMAVLTVVSIVAIFIFGFQCRPLSVAWGVGTGTCLPGSTIANTAYAVSAADIIFSWLYGLLPIYLLWSVQISMRTKLVVSVLLGFGAVSCIATILRLNYAVMVAQLPSTAAAEAVNLLLTATIYSATEVGLAIFCASLAALKPLLKLIPWIPGSSKGTSKFESGLEPRGPSIRLEDRQADTGSEENILPNSQHHIQKTTQYEVNYEER